MTDDPNNINRREPSLGGKLNRSNFNNESSITSPSLSEHRLAVEGANVIKSYIDESEEYASHEAAAAIKFLSQNEDISIRTVKEIASDLVDVGSTRLRSSDAILDLAESSPYDVVKVEAIKTFSHAAINFPPEVRRRNPFAIGDHQYINDLGIIAAHAKSPQVKIEGLNSLLEYTIAKGEPLDCARTLRRIIYHSETKEVIEVAKDVMSKIKQSFDPDTIRIGNFGLYNFFDCYTILVIKSADVLLESQSLEIVEEALESFRSRLVVETNENSRLTYLEQAIEMASAFDDSSRVYSTIKNFVMNNVNFNFANKEDFWHANRKHFIKRGLGRRLGTDFN